MYSEKVKEIGIFSISCLCLILALIIISSQKELVPAESSFAKSDPVEQENIVIQPVKETVQEPIASATENTSGILMKNNTVAVKKKESNIETELLTNGITSNFTNDSVTINWLTRAPVTTSLKLGIREEFLNRSFPDNFQKGKAYTHTVTISPLTNDSTYYISGPTAFAEAFLFPKYIDQNDNKSVIRGNIQNISGACLLRGYLYNVNTFSSNMTSFTNNKEWVLDFSNLRDSSLSTSYKLTGNDTVVIDAICVDLKGNVKSTALEGNFQSFQLKQISIEF